MEAVGASLPHKWRLLFDKDVLEADPLGVQSDAVAAGILLWQALSPAERRITMELARKVRKCKAND